MTQPQTPNTDFMNMSKSKYINQLFQARFKDFQSNPMGILDMNSLQAEAMEELQDEELFQLQDEGFEGLDKGFKAEGDTENPQKKFLGLLTTKITHHIRDKGYNQFMANHAENVFEYQTVLEKQFIFENFFAQVALDASKTPANENQTAELEKLKSLMQPKFEAAVMGLDDIGDYEITKYRSILLEDGETIITDTASTSRHEFTKIIMNLLVNDKQVQNQFIEVHKSFLPEKTRGILPSIIRASLAELKKRAEQSRGIVSERNLSLAIERMSFLHQTIQTEVNGEMVPLRAKDLVSLLKAKQFQPEIEKENIYRKLGI